LKSIFISHEIAYDAVIKAVVLEVWVQGVQANPQKYGFTENLGKFPKNPVINGA